MVVIGFLKWGCELSCALAIFSQEIALMLFVKIIYDVLRVLWSSKVRYQGNLRVKERKVNLMVIYIK